MEYSKEAVQAIVAAVLREIEREGNRIPPAASKKHLLVLLSGGMLGASEAREQLKELYADGYRMKFLFTHAGMQVLGGDWLRDAIPNPQILDEQPSESPHTLVSGADGILVPVMTFNTAAKAACGIADNPVSSVLLHALMLGKTVIAAGNACDPGNSYLTGGAVRSRMFYNRLRENLASLRAYGMTIVDAKTLCQTVRGEMENSEGISPEYGHSGHAGTAAKAERACFDGRILSVEEVRKCGRKALQVSKNTLITMAARDTALELGIEIVTVP